MTDSPTSQAMHLAMTELKERERQIAELRWIVNGFLEWIEGGRCPDRLIERARAAVPEGSVSHPLTDEEMADCGLLSELDDGGSDEH